MLQAIGKKRGGAGLNRSIAGMPRRGITTRWSGPGMRRQKQEIMTVRDSRRHVRERAPAAQLAAVILPRDPRTAIVHSASSQIRLPSRVAVANGHSGRCCNFLFPGFRTLMPSRSTPKEIESPPLRRQIPHTPKPINKRGRSPSRVAPHCFPS